MSLRFPGRPARIASALCALLGVLMLSACGGSTAATGTRTPSAGCTSLPAFAHAGAPSAGAAFGDVPFPQHAIATPAHQTASGVGLYTVTELDVCVPGSTTGAINQFYANALNAGGWTQSQYFPTDGGLADNCASGQSCWGKDAAPRFSAFDHMTDAGGGRTTYHLRLAAPPAPPTCDSSFADGYLFYLDEQQTVPVPPLTRQGVGDVAGNLQGYGMCSAGTGDSVSAFFATELPKLGWQQDATFTGTASCPFGSGAMPVWVKGSEAVQVQTFGGDQAWRMEFCPKS